LLGFHAASACHAGHAFEEFGHLGGLAEKVVGLLHRCAGAEGDALAAAAVDDRGVVAVRGPHGVDDSVHAGELGLVDVGGALLYAREGADGLVEDCAYGLIAVQHYGARGDWVSCDGRAVGGEAAEVGGDRGDGQGDGCAKSEVVA
jgi:hypothetical protein